MSKLTESLSRLIGRQFLPMEQDFLPVVQIVVGSSDQFATIFARGTTTDELLAGCRRHVESLIADSNGWFLIVDESYRPQGDYWLKVEERSRNVLYQQITSRGALAAPIIGSNWESFTIFKARGSIDFSKIYYGLNKIQPLASDEGMRKGLQILEGCGVIALVDVWDETLGFTVVDMHGNAYAERMFEKVHQWLMKKKK